MEDQIAALRDTFGDCKPPEISRKITACVACRKQKVAFIDFYCSIVLNSYKIYRLNVI